LPLYFLSCYSPAYARIFFWTFGLKSCSLYPSLRASCHCLRPYKTTDTTVLLNFLTLRVYIKYF
jgi:hypothetical protein